MSYRTPEGIDPERREFIQLAAKGVAGLAVASQVGCGGGGDDGTDPVTLHLLGVSRSQILSEDEKKAATDLVGAKAEALSCRCAMSRVDRLAEYMSGLSAFRTVQLGEEGDIYAEFTDGEPYMVTVGRQLGAEDQATIQLPDWMYQSSSQTASQPALILKAIGAKLPVNSKTACLLSATDYYDPAIFSDPAANPGTGATAHMREMAEMLTSKQANYRLSKSVVGTYEGLKNVKLVEPAVFYLNSHGWTIDLEAQLFVIPTLTPWPWLGIGVSDEFKDDLANRRIVRQSAEQVDKNNRVRMVSVVAITQYFVQKYWKFAKNALVYIDCCSLGGDSFGAMDFRQSLLNAGAGCVVAWSGRSNSGWCFPAVTKFFDLSLGTHRYSIDIPNQRPFPPEQVFSELQKLKADKGWALKPDDDPKKVAKRFLTIWPKAPTGGQLAPSIKNIEVTERGFENPLQGESKMKIFGAFGDVPGHVIEVTVDDVKMSGIKPIVGADGLIEAIECNLLSDPAQKGFAGKVIVIIDEHESNAVPLTLWQWALRSDVVVAKAANAYLQHTVEWDIYIRADVHPYRTEAHGPMTKPGPIAIRAAPGSKVKFTVTAVGIPVSRPTAELPYGLHKVPLVVGGTPVEFIDGYLFEGTMDVANNRVDIVNFYGGYYFVEARPPIPQALVLDPGYIAIPTQSPNVSFHLKDGFVIDAKFLKGSIPDSTFNAKESKPLYEPSPADNPGEDVR